MRNLIIFLAVLVFCEYSSAQILYPEPLYEEMDTTIVINKNDKGSFICNYWSNSYSERHNFNIKSGEFQAQIWLSPEKDYHYLSLIELDEKKRPQYKGEEPEAYFQPYLYFLFYDDCMLYYFCTNLKKINEYIIPGWECDTYDGSKNWKYVYNVYDYSTDNHQLLSFGKERNYFNKTFDFELGDGVPYGKWHNKFKGTVIESSENKMGKPDYIFQPIPQDYQNEYRVLGKPIRWSRTKSGLVFEFSPKNNELFYFEVVLDNKPYVKRATIRYTDRLIEYVFAKNGRISILAIENEDGYEICHYDTKKGYLKKKETVTKDSPNTYYEEVYDVRREYRKVKIKPEEGNY